MLKLIQRILRRVWYECRRQQHRLWDRFKWGAALTPFVPAPFDLNEPERVFPGAPTLLPYASVGAAKQWQASPYARSASELLAHRLPILSHGAYELSQATATPSPELRALAVEIPASVIAAYRPISWHTDFRVNYTWPKNVLFFDALLAPRSGADLKTPWELSRFVHVGQLAHCDLEVGGHEYLMQVLDWIEDNPRFLGVNWSSELVVAIRAINWIWGLQLFRSIVNRYPRAKQVIAASLYDHYLYLQRNLAYHELYSDDHYLADLVGLTYICAAFPEFRDADRWLTFSILGIEDEMKRQVLDDGYSHMMSSHYHRFVTELFVSGAALLERLPKARRDRLNSVNPASAWPIVRYVKRQPFTLEDRLMSQEFYDKLRKMGEITSALTKPNGLVPQLGDNDSARVHRFFDSVTADVRNHKHIVSIIALLIGEDLGEHRRLDGYFEAKLIAGELWLHQSSRGVPSQFVHGLMHFSHAGIGVICRGRFHLTVTCSPNGYADGKGGHGHNDKLSFELNVDGIDFIVDGGCPYYTSDPVLRNAFRSTQAHSTVIASGMEQDPLPANLFALPQRCEISLNRDGNWGFSGYHTGYNVPHRRRLEVLEDRVTIDDSIADIGERFVCFNLDPRVSIVIEEEQKGNSVVVTLLGGSSVYLKLSIIGVADVQEVDGFFGFGFGQMVKNRMLKCRIIEEEVKSVFQIIDTQND